MAISQEKVRYIKVRYINELHTIFQSEIDARPSFKDHSKRGWTRNPYYWENQIIDEALRLTKEWKDMGFHSVNMSKPTIIPEWAALKLNLALAYKIVKRQESYDLL